MYVRASRPAFAHLCERVHRSTSVMSTSLLLQLCPACLVCLTWTVFMIGGKWPYRCCICGVLPLGLVQHCSQHSCVAPLSFFFIRLVSVHVVHPYSSIDTTAAWKKLHFILSVRSDQYPINSCPCLF